jgi:transcriptional regulator with XRE-family HTH domain
MLVAKIKLLRMKYRVSRAELGSACGLSPQRIFEIENSSYTVTQATIDKLCRGMEAVLMFRQEQVDMFRTDLHKHQHGLLELVEENSYEL